MNTNDSTLIYAAVKSPFGKPALLPDDLQTVLDLVNSDPDIITADTAIKTYTVRQKYVLTRLLQAHASGLNLAMCGERLALASARQFDMMVVA